MPTHKLKTSKEDPTAAAIRDAIGVSPDEEVTVSTPQFTREPGVPCPASPPATHKEWYDLHTLPEQALRELGLRPWGREHEHSDGTESGPMLWLLPGEWYPKIPEGFPMVDINFREEKFELGKTDDDIRFGCLAFGILKAQVQ